MTWYILTIKLFVVKGHEKTSDAWNNPFLSSGISLLIPTISDM